MKIFAIKFWAGLDILRKCTVPPTLLINVFVTGDNVLILETVSSRTAERLNFA